LLQLWEAILADRLGLLEALARARWRVIGKHVVVEQGYDRSVVRDLRARGHQIEWVPWGDASFGAAVAAGLDHARGALFAAADGRRETWAAAW
jgi:gamma-glutamyltranspeptidase